MDGIGYDARLRVASATMGGGFGTMAFLAVALREWGAFVVFALICAVAMRIAVRAAEGSRGTQDE